MIENGLSKMGAIKIKLNGYNFDMDVPAPGIPNLSEVVAICLGTRGPKGWGWVGSNEDMYYDFRATPSFSQNGTSRRCPHRLIRGRSHQDDGC